MSSHRLPLNNRAKRDTVRYRLAAVLCLFMLPAARAAVAGALPCEALRSISLPQVTIVSAGQVPAGGFTPPPDEVPYPPADFTKLPAFCRVAGTIRPSPDSDIRFEVWLPAEDRWNGKFMQTGNGGAAGSILHNWLAEPLARGYAVANTDTGHTGGGGDFSWVAGHPEKFIDFQYRAAHELTAVGKAITAARYGRAPRRSYWDGCSTGGRQGLKEAQRYPGDYDAIIAGSPASNWTLLMALSVIIQANLGPGELGLDKLGLLREAEIAACDSLDGVTDRVISDPDQCRFDPTALLCKPGTKGQCLSAAEVAAARRIHAGVVDSRGNVRFPGTGPASEALWAAYASPQFSLGTNYFRDVVLHDPAWPPAAFDVDRDLAAARRHDDGVTSAMDPDLSAFIARGGKLITYHGTADGLIPYANSVNYYKSVVAKLGRETAERGVRFYLVPGMDHCGGGEGASIIDWIGALERWDESGRPPGALPAAHPDMLPGPPGTPPRPSTPFTRPACPWPQVATYRGSGDSTGASSFECARSAASAPE